VSFARAGYFAQISVSAENLILASLPDQAGNFMCRSVFFNFIKHCLNHVIFIEKSRKTELSASF